MELSVYVSVQVYLLIAVGLLGAFGQLEEAQIGPGLARSKAQEVRTWPLANATAFRKAPNRTRISASEQKNQSSNNLIKKSALHEADGTRRHETIDGVKQATRVARNVERKLDQLHDRVNQLNSIIAQDHSSKPDDKQQARLEDDSAPEEDNKTSGPSKEHWSGQLQDEQPAGASSGDSDQSNDADDGSSNSNATHARPDEVPAARSTRWSAPVIQSVIPGREQRSRNHQQQSEVDRAPPEATGEQANSELKHSSAAQNEPAPMAPDSNGIDPEQGVTNSSQEALPSMMGADWTAHQNYNYFSELNAKNHAGAGSPTAADRSPRVPSERVSAPGKFQNMTILNTDTDLVNSYSNIGARLSTANSSQPTRSASVSMPARRASGEADSEQTSVALVDHRPTKKSSSVMTYSAGNYGKSSRDLQQTSTTSQPYYTHDQAASWSPAQHTNESLRDHGSGQEQQREIRWPKLATPAPLAPSYTSSLADSSDQTQLGLPPSTSNARYSDVMIPAGSSPDSPRPYGQSQRSHRTSGDHLNNHNLASTSATLNDIHLNANEDLSTTNDDSSLSAHRYSMAQPDSPGHHQPDPSQRRRSLEAQRQLTTSTDTTIYERQHQMQQPAPIDVYSSRADSVPTGALADSGPSGSALNSSASTMSAATTMAPASLSQDLKHRSTSNAMSMEDQLISPYGSSSDGPSLSPIEAQQNQPDSGANNLFLATNSPDPNVSASFRPIQLGPAQVDASHYYLSPQADLQSQNGALGSESSPNYLSDAADSASQQQQQQHQTLVNQLDSRVNEMSPQDQQAYLSAQAAMSNRPYGQNSFSQQQQQSQAQFYSSPTSIQDAIQQAAAGGNAESTGLSFSPRHQQQIRAAQMSATSDYNAHVQRYQQKQLALASHLAQQQQLQRALEQQHHQQQSPITSAGQQSLRSPFSPLQSLVRAYYSSPSSSASLDQQPSESSTSGLASAIQNSMVKRYSPETALANYLTARSSQSANYGSDSSVSQPAYSLYQPQQQASINSQQAYVPLSYNPAALRASLAQAAYQRLLAQAAANNNNPMTSSSVVPLSQLTPSLLANLQSALANAQHQQQQVQQSSSGAGMMATAAMPQPVFYEAPSQLNQLSKPDGATSFTHDDPSHSNTRASSSLSSSSPTPAAASSSRRSYLASLFKPSASSRYYYAPTLLSPISLSPAALGTIYAPAGAGHSAADSSTVSGSITPAMGHFYANPYLLAAAMSQHAVAQPAAHPFTHPAHNQQHQNAASYPEAQSLAAQQYQQVLAAAAAASALQPQYMSAPAPQPLDTEMAESSMVASESGGSFASPSDGSNSNSNSDSSDGSTTKSAGSMKQWLTVASLLAGILPMGLVMASMLPMLGVAGRKKRELEFTARNFSEIFATWRPSKILDAIMSASNETLGLANATRILGELTSSASERVHSSSDAVKFNQGKFVGNKSARLLGSHKSDSRYHLFAHSTAEPAIVANATGSQNSSNTLNKLPHGTTPLPNVVPSSLQPKALKSTVRKVLDKVNNLIEAAQKRKHRSSSIDTQWTLAQAGGGLPNFLKNMFDFNEVKRYLADLVRAKLIASAQATNNQPLLTYLNGLGGLHSSLTDGKHTASSGPQPAASGRASLDVSQLQSSASLSDKTRHPTSTNESNSRPGESQFVATSAQKKTTIATNRSNHPDPPPPSTLTNSTSSKPTAASASAVHSINEKSDDGSLQRRGPLLSCLQNVICDLGSKLRKASMEQNSRNGTRSELDDKQMTRGILSQLIDYIVEADRETQIFGHDLRGQSRSGLNEEFMAPIQEAVLKQQCASSFVCLDPHKFKRIFAELKWPKRK